MWYATLSFLPNYCQYYDYIVKWYSGIASDWCVYLDIAYCLASNISEVPGQDGVWPIGGAGAYGGCDEEYSRDGGQSD